MTIPEHDCAEILHKLYLIREVDELIARRYPEGKMRCPVHLSVGQEGVPAALAPLLRPDDRAVSTHRGHAHYLGKGGSLAAMMAEIYGRAGGCCAGRGGSMHLIDESVGFKGTTAIVGNSIPIGVGLALAQSLRGGDAISVVFLGDGAVEEGAFYESANFAVVQGLPVLFMCENNLYSVYSSLEQRQPKGRVIHEMAAAMGLQTVAGDGNDVAATYEGLKPAIASLRRRQGPVFAEFSTYRWREHCGPNFDNDIGYRSEQEFQKWLPLEPIARFETYLLQSVGWSPERLKAIRDRVHDEIVTAFTWAEAQPFPDPETAYTDVYREATA